MSLVDQRAEFGEFQVNSLLYARGMTKLFGMVELTNLAGKKIFINLYLVRLIESAPDTVLIFNDGQKIVVKESAAQVANLFNQISNTSKLEESAAWKSQQ